MVRTVRFTSAFLLLGLVSCVVDFYQGNGGSGSSSVDAGYTGGAPPLLSCSLLPADECFSNLDCAKPTDRCENRGTDDAPVPCCVEGQRGAGQAGATCTIDNDCDTSVCVDAGPARYCSALCKNPLECPSVLPRCVPVETPSGTLSFCAS